jgi:octaprenyl-diphosphate synthase
MAFQLTDDVLDYVSYDSVLGKRVGTDLKEGKVTLPLIHALKSSTEKERNYINTVLNKANVTSKDFEQICKIIKKYGGVEYTVDTTRQFIEKAKLNLQAFKPSAYKESLITLADYMLSRET